MGIGFGAVVAHFIRYKTVAYRESDMLPVVLCRYLSLTVSVGGLFAIQQGQPKSNRINDEVITNSPTVIPWRFFDTNFRGML